jgi:Phospholipase_D-nuclease N-terminal
VSRVLPVLIALVLTIWAVIDCVQTPSSEARHLPKPLWLVCIVLVPFVGAAAWLVLGRARSLGVGRAGTATGGPAKRDPRPQPLAPDDDPDFLRSIDTGNAEHERLLRRWEEDLKRREGDLRGGNAADGGKDDEPRSDDERRRDDDPPAEEPAR